MRSPCASSRFVSLLLLSSGCVVHETRPMPPPMSDAEAVQRGESWCTSHGYGCRGALRGEGGLTYDASSRTLLGLRENVHG